MHTSLYVIMHIDHVISITLTYFIRQKEGHDGYFVDLDQILVSDTHPDVRRLYNLTGFEPDIICDKQGVCAAVCLCELC